MEQWITTRPECCAAMCFTQPGVRPREMCTGENTDSRPHLAEGCRGAPFSNGSSMTDEQRLEAFNALCDRVTALPGESEQGEPFSGRDHDSVVYRKDW